MSLMFFCCEEGERLLSFSLLTVSLFQGIPKELLHPLPHHKAQIVCCQGSFEYFCVTQSGQQYVCARKSHILTSVYIMQLKDSILRILSGIHKLDIWGIGLIHLIHFFLIQFSVSWIRTFIPSFLWKILVCLSFFILDDNKSQEWNFLWNGYFQAKPFELQLFWESDVCFNLASFNLSFCSCFYLCA